tara:strand:- start:273 stop:482 length:210 start_codon:yes stop_codon:yes gene_type:complete
MKKNIDDRVCLFYVTSRIEGIWKLFQEDDALGLKELDTFKRECIFNLGVSARLKQGKTNEQITIPKKSR